MNRHIVVATDFSTRSDRALRRATMLARTLDAQLSLVHVVDEDQPAHLIRSQVQAARPILEESARTIRAYDGIEAAATVATGDASGGILAAADAVDADLIVLGSHRRQLRDVFVGTTAERTIASSRRPVLVAAGVPSAPYGQALVALDMDSPSLAMARHFAEMGLAKAEETVALHVFDAPARGMLYRAMSGADEIEDYVWAEHGRAEARFERFMASMGPATASRLVLPITGSAARTVVETARARSVPLIVVGTSQRTGIERFVLGSVAEEVIEHADRDVLVIPHAATLADSGLETAESLA